MKERKRLVLIHDGSAVFNRVFPIPGESDLVVARIRCDVEVMEETREECKLFEKDPVPVSKVCLQIVNQPSAVLFLGAIIKGENEKIGSDQEEEEEDFEPHVPCELLEAPSDRFKREEEADEEERQEIDEVPRGDEMADIEHFTIGIKSRNGKDQ